MNLIKNVNDLQGDSGINTKKVAILLVASIQCYISLFVIQDSLRNSSYVLIINFIALYMAIFFPINITIDA